MGSKEPWQMTREEYVKTEPAKYVAVRIGGSNRLLGRQFKAFEQAGIELHDTGGAIGAGHWSNRHAVMPNTPEARDLLKSVRGRIAREQPKFYSPSYVHRVEVEKALRENKPVPPEVLRDYPELAAQVKP